MAQEHTHRKDVSAQQQRDAAAQQHEEGTHRAPEPSSASSQTSSDHDGVAPGALPTAPAASAAATPSAAAASSGDAPSKPAPTPWGRP